MMARKLITATLGFKPEKKKDTLVLRVKNAGNQTVDIEVHAATLAPLAASVISAMPMFDEPEQSTSCLNRSRSPGANHSSAMMTRWDCP